MHKNKKLKLAGKKYRVGELLKMSDEQLQEIYSDVKKELDEEKLDWLYWQYKENLKLKEQGLPYGSDLLNVEDEDIPQQRKDNEGFTDHEELQGPAI